MKSQVPCSSVTANEWPLLRGVEPPGSETPSRHRSLYYRITWLFLVVLNFHFLLLLFVFLRWVQSQLREALLSGLPQLRFRNTPHTGGFYRYCCSDYHYFFSNIFSLSHPCSSRKPNLNVVPAAVGPVHLERTVCAQPLKQWAFTEVAELCMGLSFHYFNNGSCFKTLFFFFRLCFWIIFRLFFLSFVACNLFCFLFFSPFKMKRFDWIVSLSLQAIVLFSSFLFAVSDIRCDFCAVNPPPPTNLCRVNRPPSEGRPPCSLLKSSHCPIILPPSSSK